MNLSTREKIALSASLAAVAGAIFWYTAAETSLHDASFIFGGLVLTGGILLGMIAPYRALIRRFPWLVRPVLPPMPPRPPMSARAQAARQVVWCVAGVVILAWAVYDPGRDKPSDGRFVLGWAIGWGIHDLLGLAPHDYLTWEQRRKNLEARFSKERARAPETIYALVSQGHDLESARFIAAMKLKRLERELSAARDSVAAYNLDYLTPVLGLGQKRP